MSWIDTISPKNAEHALATLYARVRAPDGHVDNILQAHSLRPHTLEGHMALYKAVLHHFRNTLSKAYLETIGVYVSLLNGCDYCVRHHAAGLERLLNDEARFDEIMSALRAGEPVRAFDRRARAGLDYVRKLALAPSDIGQSDIEILRDAGFEDGEILEINQVTSYFCYANRTVLGLGVSIDGETLGLSPNASDNPDDWGHR